MNIIVSQIFPWTSAILDKMPSLARLMVLTVERDFMLYFRIIDLMDIPLSASWIIFTLSVRWTIDRICFSPDKCFWTFGVIFDVGLRFVLILNKYLASLSYLLWYFLHVRNHLLASKTKLLECLTTEQWHCKNWNNSYLSVSIQSSKRVWVEKRKRIGIAYIFACIFAFVIPFTPINANAAHCMRVACQLLDHNC